MIAELIKQLPFKIIAGNIIQQYVTKSIQFAEVRIAEKIQDAQYKTMYMQQLETTKQQMKINEQTISLLKLIAIMQILIFICAVIRLLY